MKTPSETLQNLSQGTFSLVNQALQQYTTQPAVREIGWIRSVGSAVAQVEGLPGVEAEELVQFTGGYFGLVFNVDISEVDVVLLDHSPTLKAGREVRRTGKVLEVPVGKALLGRVVDPLGRPLDEKGDINTSEYRAVEQPAPSIIQRAPVTVPLQTGIKVIDALIPIGRGQRETHPWRSPNREKRPLRWTRSFINATGISYAFIARSASNSLRSHGCCETFRIMKQWPIPLSS